MKKLQKNSIIFFFLLFFSFISFEMHARKRIVTNGNDNLTVFPYDPNSLRGAIDIAQSGDTIVIAATINTITLNDRIALTKNLIIIGLKLINKTIITYSISVSNSLFDTNPAAATTALKIIFSNIAFQGSLTDRRAFYAGNSSGNCDIRFIDCDFKNFSSLTAQNGIAIQIVKGKLTLRDCLFENNTNLGSGAVSFEDALNDLIVKDCIFENNTSTSGGAIHTTARNTTIQWCTFQENKTNTQTGGAIYSSSLNLKIEDCRFIKNLGNDGGGAVFLFLNNVNTTANIERCYFEENKAINTIPSVNVSGGAIYLTDGVGLPITSPVLIRNCTFWKNEAYEGGGIFLIDMGANRVDIVSNTFVGNKSTSIASNIEDRGGAIRAGNAQECYLDYNVAVNNAGTNIGKDFASQFALKTVAGNNVYDIGSNVNPFVPGNPFGVSNTNNNPPPIPRAIGDLFDTPLPNPLEPKDNGGFSKTFKPKLGGTLIGRTPANNLNNLPKFDQRFFPRGTLIDVGACERILNTNGEIEIGAFLDITSLASIENSTNNSIVIKWRDRFPGTTTTYQIIRNDTLLPATLSATTFTDINVSTFNTPTTYQIQANKQTTVFQIDKYKSQKAAIILFKDVVNATEIQDNQGISVYPNPCKERIFVSLEKTLNLSKENKISIFSIFGQKIITQNISTQQTEVVLPENLPNGLYFIEIKLGEKRSVKKIIIE